LVTARQAAGEEGITRKRLATKQCQGSVSYGVGSQAIYREPCSSRRLSRMEPRETAGEIEYGAHRVGGCRIEIISCNWLKCAINPIVNPIPVYGH
jgi:hypothetical protein